jgi:hypothetical protein
MRERYLHFCHLIINILYLRFLEDAKGDFPMLTPDYVYDYFEPILRKEPYTSEIHKIYETTSKVLQKLDEDSLAAKIVKTISLIYIVEQFEKLPPIKGIIIDTYRDCVSDVQIIDDVLTELVEKECLIYLKRSNGYLKIKESSGVDIGAEIQNVIEKTKQTLSVKDILNSFLLIAICTLLHIMTKRRSQDTSILNLLIVKSFFQW